MLFGLGPIDPGHDAGSGSEPYDPCAPGGYDDPIRYNHLTSVPASWSEARLDCQRRGMDLAVFNDPFEMGKGDGDWPYWFGVYESDAGTWTTIDGCPAVGMPPPIPDPPAPICAAMFSALGPAANPCDGVIADPAPSGLTQIAGALCETPRPQTAACLPKDPKLEVYTVSPMPLGYEAAAAFCAEHGAHLVVVDSHEELQLLSDLVASGQITRGFWIGATFDGTWHAITGCPGEFSWTGVGPQLAGGALPSCAATVLEPDDQARLTLRGMAITPCDNATTVAVCESH